MNKKLKSQSKKRDRNWILVSLAGALILLDLLIIGTILFNGPSIRWWEYGLILGALSSMYLACKAIKTNNPVWLLLDLVLPN